jgi:hypothetical protein
MFRADRQKTHAPTSFPASMSSSSLSSSFSSSTSSSMLHHAVSPANSSHSDIPTSDQSGASHANKDTLSVCCRISCSPFVFSGCYGTDIYSSSTCGPIRNAALFGFEPPNNDFQGLQTEECIWCSQKTVRGFQFYISVSHQNEEQGERSKS